MTARAGTTQSTGVRRPGRIIERPRLIKLLDEADAPVILIVAPAGYGKTTLARQWARTLTGVVWVSCTPSHRDVVTFSEDVAAGIDALGGNASRFIGEYVRARSNPQRSAREIALALVGRLDEAAVQWLVIDDYQELAQSPALEVFIQTLKQRSDTRMLVASRTRPAWATARELVYAEVTQLGISDLALTPSEVVAVLGRRPELDPLVRKAQGWPAVVALAAGLSSVGSGDSLPARLHQYVAEELYSTAAPTLQQQLIDLALLPDLTEHSLRAQFGDAVEAVICSAADLGYITRDPHSELHPMLREFLLSKLAQQDEPERVRSAVDSAANAEQWGFALELVLRFDLQDLIDPVLQRAFKPLIRSGRLETLSNFSRRARAKVGFPLPALEVIEAELASRNGEFGLAASIAHRAHDKLPHGHQMKCRASLLAGRAHVLQASLAESINCYRAAAEEALDDSDKVESVFGLAAAETYGEDGNPHASLAELKRLSSLEPTNLLRYATAASNLRRMAGFNEDLLIDEAVRALPLTPDPLVRSSFVYSSSYVLCVRGEYRRAEELLELFEREVNDYDLDFARPFLHWTRAFAHLGLRRFGEADRYLQRVEDAAAAPPHLTHGFNARLLRARLMLQTGEAGEAVELLDAPAEATVYRSWQGELIGIRALALACLGQANPALRAARDAESMSRFAEVVLFARCAEAVVASTSDTGTGAIRQLFGDAERFDAWDAVICATRITGPRAASSSRHSN
jgi:ATP/maltotriose-dependent transcriptional regulator MalT